MQMDERRYAIRFGESAFTGYTAKFHDIAGLQTVIQHRQDVPPDSQLSLQSSKADELSIKWDLDVALPPLPWVTLKIPSRGRLNIKNCLQNAEIEAGQYTPILPQPTSLCKAHFLLDPETTEYFHDALPFASFVSAKCLI